MPLTRTTLPRLAATAGLATLLAVSGCSSSATPKTQASASTSPDTAGPALISPEAKAPVAAVKAYYVALSQATNTGTVGPVRQLATSECLCQKVVDVLETYFKAGRTFTGYDFAVDGVEQAQVQGDAAAVRIRYSVAAYESSQGGKKLGEDPARSGTAVIGLELVDGQWLVSTVSDLTAPSAAPA